MAEETPPKRLSIQQLADLAGTDELPEQYRPRRGRAAEEDLSLPFQPAFIRPPAPPPKPQVYSLRLDRLRKLPDDQLMRYLTREEVPDDGVLDTGVQLAINAELTRRQAAKAARPKLWKDVFFWLGLAGVIFAAIAAWPILFPSSPLAAESRSDPTKSQAAATPGSPASPSAQPASASK